MERIQQLILNMPQFIGQIHMDRVRVNQTFGLVPECVQFLLAVGLDIHYLRGIVYALAVQEDGHKQFP